MFLKFQAMMWKAGDVANAISITYILAEIMLTRAVYRRLSALQAIRKTCRGSGCVFFLGASIIPRFE
jgi:hypothetical protein